VDSVAALLQIVDTEVITSWLPYVTVGTSVMVIVGVGWRAYMRLKTQVTTIETTMITKKEFHAYSDKLLDRVTATISRIEDRTLQNTADIATHREECGRRHPE
jgi:guanylate kinase